MTLNSIAREVEALKLQLTESQHERDAMRAVLRCDLRALERQRWAAFGAAWETIGCAASADECSRLLKLAAADRERLELHVQATEEARASWQAKYDQARAQVAEMMAAAFVEYDNGYLEIAHDKDCAQDEPCTCGGPQGERVRLLVNGPKGFRR